MGGKIRDQKLFMVQARACTALPLTGQERGHVDRELRASIVVLATLRPRTSLEVQALGPLDMWAQNSGKWRPFWMQTFQSHLMHRWYLKSSDWRTWPRKEREKQGPKPLIPSAGTGRKEEDTVKAEGQGALGQTGPGVLFPGSWEKAHGQWCLCELKSGWTVVDVCEKAPRHVRGFHEGAGPCLVCSYTSRTRSLAEKWTTMELSPTGSGTWSVRGNSAPTLCGS